MAGKTIYHGLKTALRADARVAAITTRVYWSAAPQRAALPYVVLQMISRTPEHHFGGPEIGHRVVQVDCYAKSTSDGSADKNIRKLAEAVRLALDGFSGSLGDEAVFDCVLFSESDRDEPPQDKGQAWTRRVLQEYEIWHRETVPQRS